MMPLVLLGIRASLREEFQCSSAELVYGTTLRLPSEFFQPPPSMPSVPVYVQFLRDVLQNIRPSDVGPRQSNRPVYVPKDLSTCDFVYIRTDSVRKPLQPPYQHAPFTSAPYYPYLHAYYSCVQLDSSAPLAFPFGIVVPYTVFSRRAEVAAPCLLPCFHYLSLSLLL
eukprot:scpid23771/ scgid19806/ 